MKVTELPELESSRNVDSLAEKKSKYYQYGAVLQEGGAIVRADVTPFEIRTPYRCG